MGICTAQYRLAIGLFNCVKYIRCSCHVSCRPLAICAVVFILIAIMLLIAGDVESNPGPTMVPKLKNLKLCHVNIRGLNLSKLRALQVSLFEEFDVVSY